MAEETHFFYFDGSQKSNTENKRKVTSVVTRKTWKRRRAVTGHRLSLVAQKPHQPPRPSGNDEGPSSPVLEMRDKSEDVHIQFHRWMQSNQKQSLTLVCPPEILKISEDIFHTAFLHLDYQLRMKIFRENLGVVQDRYPVPGVSPRKPFPVIETPEPGQVSSYSRFSMAIQTAIDSFRSHDTTKTTASLEQAFQDIKPMLDISCSLTWCYFLEAIIHMKAGNLPQVHYMLVRYIMEMATIVYGSQHPYAIVARNLLRVLDMNDVIEALLTLLMNTVEQILGNHQILTFNLKTGWFSSKFLLRRDQSTIQDATAHYNALYEEAKSFPRLARHYRSILQYELGTILFKFEDLKRAESVLYLALADLDEYVSQGYKSGLGPDAPPISIGLVIKRLILLGRIFKAQKMYSEAMTIFEQAIQAGNTYLGHEHRLILDACFQLSEILALQHHHTESKVLEDRFVQALEPYMLHSKAIL